ncbi:MAG: glycosyltransferase [Actinomycetota bacterium]|nr:glycosyltransferase [Actinomycetota bacterium]MDP3630590.1 glycosyltransferase [Actinomycetota bacterium]
MTKGTILYIGGFELPDNNAAAHRVFGVAKALRVIGYEVVLIGVSKGPLETIEQGRREIQGFDTWSLPYPQSTKDWIEHVSSIDALSTIGGHYERVTTVILYNYPAMALSRAMLYCRRRRIKCLCDCTEWYGMPRGLSLSAVAKAVDTVVRMRILQKRTDGVICISSYLQRYYESQTATVLVPPLVDLDEEKWRSGAVQSESAGKTFVYSGSPGRDKDRLDVVVESLATLDESLSYTFKVLGVTQAEYLGYYPEHREVLIRLGHRVIFLGRVPHSESLTHVRFADFTVFIRQANRANNAGFPTKFVESTACGTPVITTETSDLGRYVHSGENGFLVCSDADELGGLLADIIKGEAVLDHGIDSRVFDYRSHVEGIRAFLATLDLSGGMNV